MKYILYTALAVALLTGTAFGATKVADYIRLADGQAQNVYSSVFEKEDLKVVKFMDGKTTCYMAVTEVGGRNVNTAISCIK